MQDKATKPNYMKTMKGSFVIMTSIIAPLLSADTRQNPVEFFRTDGEISQAQSGWTYDAGAGTNTVYLPFEGNYPDKGGRRQSPVFSLNKNDDRPGYYRLRFKAQSAEHCYWWLDYFDQNGRMLPDCNSAVYPGNDYRNCDQVVYVPGAVRKIQIAFVSKGQVKASDVRFSLATAKEAAWWCDEVYKTLPPLQLSPPSDFMKLLPKTAAALKNGAPWQVVMLGDSIINDTFNSNFQSLLQRLYPEANLSFICSVRGSTGCRYYQEPEHFKSYVADLKPDLLIIGGISHEGNIDAIRKVIETARQNIGCEVLLMTGPLGADWRKYDKEQPEAELTAQTWTPDPFIEKEKQLAEELHVGFLDMASVWHTYLGASHKPWQWFNRDRVHGNDRGKQIAGRIIEAYFKP